MFARYWRIFWPELDWRIFGATHLASSASLMMLWSAVTVPVCPLIGTNLSKSRWNGCCEPTRTHGVSAA